MEKKVLSEILRIKELIGEKNLLTEDTLPVKIIRGLTSIFKNESDDVVKKIINSNDNLVAKLKNGNLNPEEAALIIKNAGGREAFYYKTARETFNQKNYKDFYTDIQTLKNIGTMDKLPLYNAMIDQDIPNLLPNASEEFRTEMKNMLKDDLKTYIDNKTKTNPILQDVPNKPTKKTKINKVKNPISSPEGGSFLDNVPGANTVLLPKAERMANDYIYGEGAEFKKFLDEILKNRQQQLEKRYWADAEKQFNYEISELGKKAEQIMPVGDKDLAEYTLKQLNGMKNIAVKNQIVEKVLSSIKQGPLDDSTFLTIKDLIRTYIYNGGPNKLPFLKWCQKTFFVSSIIAGVNLGTQFMSGIPMWPGKKIGGARAILHFVPGVNILSAVQSLLFTLGRVAKSVYDHSDEVEDTSSTKEKVTLYAFKLLLQTSTMPSKYIENVQYDATTEKFMYHHPTNGTIYEIFDVGKDANTAFIRSKPTKKYPDGQKHYLTKFKKE